MQEKEFVDFYELLELDSTASSSQIRRQYRAKSLVYHPDKATGSDALFHRLKLAFDTLSDASKRSEYDRVYSARRAHAARLASLSLKRAADRADLEAREQNAAKRSNNSDVNSSYSADVARHRSVNAQAVRLAQQAALLSHSQATCTARDTPDGPEATIIVTWKLALFSLDDINAMFSPFGSLTLSSLPSKKQDSKRARAAVAFDSILASGNAFDKISARQLKGLKLAWAIGHVSGKMDALRKKEHIPSDLQASLKPEGMTDKEYEDDTLARLMSMK